MKTISLLASWLLLNIPAIVLTDVSGGDASLIPDRLEKGSLRNSANQQAGRTKVDGAVDTPQMSVASGFFNETFSVEIGSTTAGADIRFTTDGSAPTAETGTVYTGPVPITGNTVLRAIAFRPGYPDSTIATHTYLFLPQIVSQNLDSAMQAGFPDTWGGNTPGTYAMNPDVTGPSEEQMEASLRSLPSIFIATSVSNLFDPDSGIYVKASEKGKEWERPISVEWIDTNGQSGFQVDCGLRIQGGVGRTVAKHSFRLLFKREYGVGSLKYDLFQEHDAVKSFDGLVLRAGFNDSWFWISGMTGKATYLRDEFGRRLLLAMGHPSARGCFAHLYLNGLYWGLYNVTERPNEDFSASYMGDQPADWDANCSNETKNGDTEAWNSFINEVKQTASPADYQKLQGNNPDGSRNPDYPVFLDKLDYIDYVILNFWGGNWDWPEKNFWYGRLRTSVSTGFKFYPWDIEGIVDDAESSLDMVTPRMGDEWGVGPPHHYLKSFAEYQLDFADRVQKYFFNGGLLTPSVLADRFNLLADQIDCAILSESARWGNGDPNTQSQDAWCAERDSILRSYLPNRTDIVLNQFINSGLYPNVAAPVFSQYGGEVSWGYPLVISQAGGTVYYTLDGSDPRTYGSGTAASSASVYGSPIVITAPTLVRARVLQGTQWSALVEATFHPPQDLRQLALSEIMYHPPALATTNGEEFEFLELQNTGTNSLDLSGLHFTSGIVFTFTNGTILAPGKYFVLARNAAAFMARYTNVTPQGIYFGKLANNGDNLTLVDGLSGTVFSIKYDQRAPWPISADGLGLSLQRLRFSAPESDPGNWVAAWPTPGLANSIGDTDGDGMPDAWEITNGADPRVPDAKADADHDGFTNLQEFLAGTDPRDASSVLQLSCVNAPNHSIALKFQAVADHSYSLLWSTAANATIWNKLLEIPAQTTNQFLTITQSLSGHTARFFRLITPAQP